ncbi:MAG: CAP domain-containing protein [Pseudomonadota bacterium]
MALRTRVPVVLLCLLVAGCGMPRISIPFFGDEKPSATVPKVPRERSVDPARAIALINEHRSKRGRPPLKHDPKLSRIARETAQELARRNQLRTEMHTKDGLARRLDAAQYGAGRAAENLGAGYPTLVMAVDGWKKSRGHNRNLLNGDMTHAGIGLALTQQGPYQSFWVLLLAKPDQPA